MTRPKLAICDEDKVYCHRLDEYLHGNLNLSFDIFSFTDLTILTNFAKKEAISLLIISENLFNELCNSISVEIFKNIMILDESAAGGSYVREDLTDDNVKIEHLSKFQEASKIVGSIIELCAASPDDFLGVSTASGVVKGNIFGFFAPISKCGQTSFARLVAQKLAEKGKTIFLSFESFSALPQILGVSTEGDITDLLYFAECERTKLGIFLEKIKFSKDGVDYIMPAKSAMQLREIGCEKVRALLEVLTGEAGYEYVVLDLTDHPEGFLDICLLCRRIFTVIRNNPGDMYRQKVYEEVLIGSGYEEVKARTAKIQLPDYRDKRALGLCVDEVLKREAL